METMAMRFTVSSDVRSDTDNDGTAILQIKQDKIYTIVGVGSAIWSKLVVSRQGLAASQIAEALSADFRNIPRQQIDRDVQHFLTTFHQKGFIHEEQERSKFRESSRRFAGSTFLFLARTTTALLLQLRLRVLAAFCGLATIDFLIKLVSFSALYNFVRDWPIGNQRLDNHAIDQINEAVTRALSWYPKQAMCLQRSAVTTSLLRSSGVPAQLIIGCQKLPFLVHAWVEVDHEVVNDQSRVQEIHRVLDRC
jgi:transglutaminase superfamily protein/coenzyme PQQ synthesis protein D (PqqD)